MFSWTYLNVVSQFQLIGLSRMLLRNPSGNITGCIRQGLSFHSVYSVRPDKRSFTMKYMVKEPCQVVPNIPNEQISLAECTRSLSFSLSLFLMVYFKLITVRSHWHTIVSNWWLLGVTDTQRYCWWCCTLAQSTSVLQLCVHLPELLR